MALPVVCPSCQSNYQLPESVAGRKVRCKKCQHVFRVEADAPPGPAPARKSDPDLRKATPAAATPRRLRDEDDGGGARPWPKRGRAGSNQRALVIGGVAGGLLCLGGGIAGVALMLKPSPPPAANNAPAVAANAAVPTVPPRTETGPGLSAPAVAPSPAASGGKDDAIPLPTLQAIKDATVFIKVDAGPLRGSGTGFVISAQGDVTLIVTNDHVVNPKNVPSLPGLRPSFLRVPAGPAAAKLTAVFGSGTPQEQSHPAELLAADKEYDLAVLKVSGVRSAPRPIDFSQEVPLHETMPIYSFGFPFGESLALDKANPAITVGKGSVSSIRRDANNEVARVQVDGALNPGNSGGPLVDTQGRLVGVAVAIVKGANNIGFAVPSQRLTQLANGRAGAVEVKVINQDQQDLEVEVSAPLIDLWQRVNGATLYYRTGLPAPGQSKDAFAALPDTQKVALKLDQGKAAGRFRVALPAGRPAVDLVCQVAVGDREGKTTVTGLTSHTLRPGSTPPAGAAASTQLVANQPNEPPAGWKEYRPPDGSFVVWLPDKGGSHGERTLSRSVRGLRMKVSGMQYRPPGGPAYEVSAVSMSAQVARQVPRDEMIAAFRDGFVEEVKGKVLSEQATRQGRLTGKEFLVQAGPGLGRLRIFTLGARTYLVAITGTQEQAQGADAVTFLESFRVPDRPAAAGPAQPARPPALPRQGKPLTPQDLPAVLAGLKAGDQFTIGRALDALAAAEPVAAEKDKVVAALEGVLNTSDQFSRVKAAKALAVWGGPDSIPALAKLLNDKQFVVRFAVLDLLRDMKAVKAAPEVAQCMIEQSDRMKAAEALKAMGPEAEPEVLKLVAHTDDFICFEACRVLKEIGTEKSLATLKQAATRRRGLVPGAARDAIAAISLRKGGAR